MVHGSMEIVHEGWITKSPPPKRILKVRWRTRWFVLRSGELPGQYLLEYYVDHTRKKLKGRIDLDQCEQVDAGIRLASQKESPETNVMFDIRTPGRIYYLRCQTEAEMNQWVDCLCQVCGLKAQSEEAALGNPLLPPAPIISSGHQALHSATSMDLNFTGQDTRTQESNISPSSISSISGPYIPISECITGRKATSNNISNNQSNSSNNHNTNNSRGLMCVQNSSTVNNRRISIPSEMAPPAPLSASSLSPSNTSLATNSSSTSTLVADSNLASGQQQLSYCSKTNSGAKPRSDQHTASLSYDQTRMLRGEQMRQQTRSSAGNSEDGGVRSPQGTDTSSGVFTDDDWSSALQTPRSLGAGHGCFFGAEAVEAARDGSVVTHACRTHVKDSNKAVAAGTGLADADREAPPRPPKPAHLEVPQQNYMNIDTIVRTSASRKNSIAESTSRKFSNTISIASHDGALASSSDAEPSPLAATSSLTSTNTSSGLADELHEYPRSHMREPLNSLAMSATDRARRHAYNTTAVPSSVTSDRVFSYDMRDPAGVVGEECDPKISPVLYSNLSSVIATTPGNSVCKNSSSNSKSPGGPPSVNRGLKPKLSASDDTSPSVGIDPLAPCTHPSSAAPLVDRNLKPSPKPGLVGADVSSSSNPATQEFVLEPAPRSRPKGGVVRASPSPTPPGAPHHQHQSGGADEDSDNPPQSAHSWRSSDMPEEQVFYPAHSLRSPPVEIQYLDLDLNSAGGSQPALGSLPKQQAQKDNKKNGGSGGVTSAVDTDVGAVGGASMVVTNKMIESSKVEYQTVDFFKTEALTKMRKNIENNYKNNQT